jgi:hypothetical protein
MSEKDNDQIVCPNCGHKNPINITKCEKCGETFNGTSNELKILPENFIPNEERPNLKINILRNSFLFLILALIVLFSFTYFCVVDIPNSPNNFSNNFILSFWEEINSWQSKKCNTNIVQLTKNILLTPTQEGCTNPSIIINPENGTIGSTFIIYLNDFSKNDHIKACWYFPSGDLINCADLEADENGYRKTKFWSEIGNPPGNYKMEVIGKCSKATIYWMITSNE